MINYSGNFEPHENAIVENLPAGAYVGKIVDAEVKKIQSSNGDFERLELKVDVTDGEYKDHYAKLYESQANGLYPARWKGVIRFNIPQVGSQYESGQKRALEHLAWCLQDSNAKYKWDNDENKMKGLAIGFSVRERDWLMERDGELAFGTTTEVARVESIHSVADGRVKPMKKRELKDSEKEKLAAYQASHASESGGGMVQVFDEEIPF